MKKSIVIAACMLATSIASAQVNTITIKGKVTDDKTKEAVGYATVYSENRLYYTTTNADGEYVLKLPETMTDSRVVFSQAGYNRDTVSVASLMKKGNVRLTAGGIELREVKVQGFKNAKALMKEVIRRIPENYHTDTMICTGFFRNVSTVNDSLYLFEEHIADMLRVGYGKNPKQSYTNTRGINSNYTAMRKLRLLDYDTVMLQRMTHSNVSTRVLSSYSEGYTFRDRVEIYKSYMSKIPKNATMKEFTDDDGMSYYVVSTDNNVFTIEQSSLAVVRIEHHSKPSPLITLPIYLLPFGNQFKELCPIRKFGFASDEVYVYGKVGDRYTLVSYNITRTTRYVNETTGRWQGVVPMLTVDEHSTFQLIGQKPGHWSFIKQNGINPQYARSQPYSEIPVSDKAYSDDFWEQYNYVPLESLLLEKLNAKQGKRQ